MYRISTNTQVSNTYIIYSKILEFKTTILNLDIVWEDARDREYEILRSVSKNKNHPQIQINKEKRIRIKYEILNLYELALKFIVDSDNRDSATFINGFYDDIVQSLKDSSMKELIEDTQKEAKDKNEEDPYPLFVIVEKENYNLAQFRKEVKRYLKTKKL